MKQELDDRGIPESRSIQTSLADSRFSGVWGMRLRRAIGILGNVLVCLGFLCLLLGILLLVGEDDHIVLCCESWWWNLVLGHGVFEPWWKNWVVSLGAFAVGAVLMFGIAPVLVNWAKEGKFSWHS